MRIATFITVSICVMMPLGCSEDQAMESVKVSAQADLAIAPGDLGNNLNNSPEYLARKLVLENKLATELQQAGSPLIDLGKAKLLQYRIDPAYLSTDPTDPKFAYMAIVIQQLEILYAAGYAVQLTNEELQAARAAMSAMPPLSPVPEAYGYDFDIYDPWGDDEDDGGGGSWDDHYVYGRVTKKEILDCVLELGGLGSVVQMVQNGATAAGVLTGEVVVGTIIKLSSKAALGWVGAGIVAYQFGDCLAAANNNYNRPELFTEEMWRQKLMEDLIDGTAVLRKKVSEFKEQHQDTASLILAELEIVYDNPFKH